jgi:hypothetical protein
MFRSTNGASTSLSASSRPDRVVTYCVSRRCPGPSATITLAAPIRRNATIAAATSLGSVLIAFPGSYSTKFGFSTTFAPDTSAPIAASPSPTTPSSPRS